MKPTNPGYTLQSLKESEAKELSTNLKKDGYLVVPLVHGYLNGWRETCDAMQTLGSFYYVGRVSESGSVYWKTIYDGSADVHDKWVARPARLLEEASRE